MENTQEEEFEYEVVEEPEQVVQEENPICNTALLPDFDANDIIDFDYFNY
jgi:hypothetical protein